MKIWPTAHSFNALIMGTTPVMSLNWSAILLMTSLLLWTLVALVCHVLQLKSEKEKRQAGGLTDRPSFVQNCRNRFDYLGHLTLMPIRRLLEK